MVKTKIVNVHKEPCDICIMRPGRWQNRHRIGVDGDRETVIAKHRIDMLYSIRYDDSYLRALLELRGQNLGCCCKPEPCHGDNYINILDAKVIGIVGTRRRVSPNDYKIVEEKFFSIYKPGNIIVSGGCKKGGDRFAEHIADNYNIPIMRFLAQWNRYGKGAGFVRNTDIARESWDLIACISEDRTGGTEDTIKKFLKSSTPVGDDNFTKRLIVC